MGHKSQIHTTLRREDWNIPALEAINEVSSVGTYTKYKNMPPTKYIQRATFSGFAKPPETNYDKFHQHLVLLNERFSALQDAGVRSFTVECTVFFDGYELLTEIQEEDIALLARVNAALTFTAVVSE